MIYSIKQALEKLDYSYLVLALEDVYFDAEYNDNKIKVLIKNNDCNRPRILKPKEFLTTKKDHGTIYVDTDNLQEVSPGDWNYSIFNKVFNECRVDALRNIMIVSVKGMEELYVIDDNNNRLRFNEVYKYKSNGIELLTELTENRHDLLYKALSTLIKYRALISDIDKLKFDEEELLKHLIVNKDDEEAINSFVTERFDHLYIKLESEDSPFSKGQLNLFAQGLREWSYLST